MNRHEIFIKDINETAYNGTNSQSMMRRPMTMLNNNNNNFY